MNPIRPAPVAAPASVRRPKIFEVDLFRAAAIVAVVLIHATSGATVRPPEGGTAQRIYVLLNSLPHFSVPAFLFISGLVLAYQYAGRWISHETIPFFRKRVLRSIVPLVLWSAFYVVWYAWLDGNSLAWPKRDDWLRLLRGGASYHLYFLVLIVQYYAIMPLLLSAAKASRSFRRYLPVLGIVVQASYYLYCRRYAPDAYASEVGLTYFAQFTAGCWLGLHYEWFAARAYWLWRVLLPAAVAAGAAYGWLTLEARYTRPEWSLDVHVVAVNVYSLVVAFALAAVSRALMDAVSAKGAGSGPDIGVRNIGSGFLRLLRMLGASSFGIYLLHPAILRLFGVLWNPPASETDFAWYTIAAFGVSLGGAWLLAALYAALVGTIRRRARRAVS